MRKRDLKALKEMLTELERAQPGMNDPFAVWYSIGFVKAGLRHMIEQNEPLGAANVCQNGLEAAKN